MVKRLMQFVVIVLSISSLVACVAAPAASTGSSQSGSTSNTVTNTVGTKASGGSLTLTLGAYSTPRDAYAKIIPLFQAQWKAKTGQDVKFEESYLGSGAQSRAIVQGFEADIAALSLEADITNIAKAKLITHDWKSGPQKGMVSDSVVAFAVRKGNPKGIKDWADLAKPGLEILTPNPKTSGGAMWNILALYGAAKQGLINGVPKDDDAAAQKFLLAVLNNVTALDKDARSSITNFEQGVGDIAITYENEVKVAQKSGKDDELVIPAATILIENPVAVVDVYVDKHGTRAAAEAFVNFLYTKEAQQIFADYGLRSIDPDVAKATAAQYPKVANLFDITYFGGWDKATPQFFGPDGIYTKTVAQVQKLSQ
ncbi:MAG: sulfate ABC transporter substrate-binding protein [Caldilineaceae bacterium]